MRAGLAFKSSPILPATRAMISAAAPNEPPAGSAPTSRRGWHSHASPGQMGEPGMQALGVLRPLSPALAYDRPDGNGPVAVTIGFESPERQPVGDGVERVEHEIQPLMNDDGAEARKGSAHGRGRHQILGHGKVLDAAGAELVH